MSLKWSSPGSCQWARELSAAAEWKPGLAWWGLEDISVIDAWWPQATSHEPPSPQHCSGLAFSVVRASASVCEELKIFTPAGLRWSPGHGQPNYCLSKATDMPGILETKPNQNPSLKICFEPWGFSRGLHGSKHKIRESWVSYRRKQKTQNRKDT